MQSKSKMGYQPISDRMAIIQCREQKMAGIDMERNFYIFRLLMKHISTFSLHVSQNEEKYTDGDLDTLVLIMQGSYIDILYIVILYIIYAILYITIYNLLYFRIYIIYVSMK